ncbi:hypothetical protein LSM04_006245 [Trypanosoma melophagium]|uniref:uncharacterized protein n=1 Tax=Trypanosoma melophagium TaxID=715481 RepID=UPI00351A0739|nr:hypothetical protein LSM04_006245 [Trypanosoma melophagium]
MPSRAVLRKKARRESKRSKRDADAAAAAVVHSITSHKQQKQEEKEKGPYQQHEKEEPQQQICAVVKEGVAVVNRKRVRAAVDSTAVEAQISTEAMKRKERKRFETKRRLERQLLRLNAGMPTANTTDASNNNNINTSIHDTTRGDTEKEEGEEGNAATTTTMETNTSIADAKAASSPVSGTLRHDPKFTNGNFWRTRKERRQRTVFLGNVPIQFTEQNVMDLVSTAVDAAGVAGRLVETVDFLPAKPRARQRHMYVTLCTRDIAAQVVGLLDAYKLAGSELRCNFAADKAQRSEAISRRSGNTVRS